MAPPFLPYSLPLPYSRERCHEYAAIATAVRDQVFDVYEQYLNGELHLDPAKWKLVKQKENVQIHYSKQHFPPSALHKPLDATLASPEVLASADWMPMVKLVVTGTTLGSMDDAMYGAASPTQESMLMKSMTIQDDFYHHRTLKDIQIPTPDDPFTYIGLKWSARSSYIGSLIKARDMVYIESNGFRDVLVDGVPQKCGYTLYHSVELPEIQPLESQDILRSKYSAIVLYRQAAPGVVDVFSTTSLFPNGELMFKVTAFQAAEALIAVTKVTESAMKKKLVWMQAARAYGAPNATSGYLPSWQSRVSRLSFSEKMARKTASTPCVQCSRNLSAVRSLTTCEICATQVCSRCITSRKLVLGHTTDELVYKSVAICKGCIHTAQHMDNSAALAVYEFVQPFDRIRSQFRSERFNSSSATSASSSSEPLNLSYVDELNVDATTKKTKPARQLIDEDADVIDVEFDRTNATNKRFSDAEQREKLRLWQQINDLCLQAEHTYRLAVQQTQEVVNNDPYH